MIELQKNGRNQISENIEKKIQGENLINQIQKQKGICDEHCSRCGEDVAPMEFFDRGMCADCNEQVYGVNIDNCELS